MALIVCDECTTKFSVGAKQCPQCGSKKHHEDGDESWHGENSEKSSDQESKKRG